MPTLRFTKAREAAFRLRSRRFRRRRPARLASLLGDAEQLRTLRFGLIEEQSAAFQDAVIGDGCAAEHGPDDTNISLVGTPEV